MAKRRNNREGNISKRPSGRYQAQVYVSGNRFYKTFDTHRDCVRWIRELENRFDQGLSSKGVKLRISEYLMQWLEWKKTEIQQKTWDQYSSLIDRFILPTLGEKILLDLKPIDIQNLYSLLRADEISPRRVQLTHSIFHAALERALQLGLINRNPIHAVKRPKVITKEMKILNKEQAYKFLQVAANHRIYALFRIALLGGLRLGELLGLQWKDVNWAASELQIKRQSQRKIGGGIELQQPKTAKSIRSIQLGNETLKALMNHYENQKILIGDDPLNGQQIFVNVEGKPLRSSGVQKAFKVLLKKASIPSIRFHDLRHTAASLLLAQGMPVLEVSRQLGHSRASTTLDVYAHLVPGIKSDAVEKLDISLSTIAAELLRSEDIDFSSQVKDEENINNMPDFPSKSV